MLTAGLNEVAWCNTFMKHVSVMCLWEWELADAVARQLSVISYCGSMPVLFFWPPNSTCRKFFV